MLEHLLPGDLVTWRDQSGSLGIVLEKAGGIVTVQWLVGMKRRLEIEGLVTNSLCYYRYPADCNRHNLCKL